MKKLICSAMAAVMTLSGFTCTFAESSEEAGAKYGLGAYIDTVESVDTVKVPLYIGSKENAKEIELLILNGLQDIPYASLDDIVNLMNDMIGAEYPGYSLTLTDEGNGAIFVVRDNESVMMVDTDSATISFSDSDLFARMPGAANGLDVNHIMPDDPAYEVTLYRTSSILYREKHSLEYRLNDYDIYMHMQDGKIYLPLQTLSDVLLSTFNACALYNRKCVMITDGIAERGQIDEEIKIADYCYDGISEAEIEEVKDMVALEQECYVGGKYDLSRSYYLDGEPHAKSDELSVFSYNELCMAMDHNYGLQEEHRIDSFDELFKETGYAADILTDDAYESYLALRDLIDAYLADGHSGMDTLSYMCEYTMERHRDIGVYKGNKGQSKITELYSDTSIKYYPDWDGIPGYEEVGNTAIITLEQFSMSGFSEYYTNEITDDKSDTIGLMIYANRQINRENSPIERVVIDLTMNGGGAAPAAACMVSWILGYSDFQLENMITGTQAIVRHEFDVNLDHVIDEQDCLLTANPNIKGIYCLVGPISFSCANIVPASLKGNAKVTIIGKTSGGGACSVQRLSTAEGNTFTVSSPVRINTVKNGTFYSVDEGVTPDVYIDNVSHMYDRQYLVDMINGLS